jgi:hypothetical protein
MLPVAKTIPAGFRWFDRGVVNQPDSADKGSNE